MKNGNISDRRHFLKKTVAGTALLAGHAFLPGRGLNANIARSASNSVTIPTHEWYGDIDERLDFPDAWKIDMIKMAGNDEPALSPEQIRTKMSNPVNSKRLSEIAEGKKTAVITFDDLTRPTPVGKIAPYVIEELKKGGIKEENILFLGSYGNHRLMNQVEVRAKLGDDIVENYPWINHNCWDNLTEVGVTSFGNRVELNYYFMKADIKITISGVKPHGAAGYGGGAKAIVPGVCSLKTTYYNHGVVTAYPQNHTGAIGSRNETTGRGKLLHNEVRLDMEEAAVLAGLDFTVQIVYNGKREPIDIVAGECRQAHIAACKIANKKYTYQPPSGNCDIVINNTYPQARQGQYQVGANQGRLNDGGSSVLVLQNPMGVSTFHYLAEHRSFTMQSYWDMLPEPGSARSRAAQTIIFSQYLQKRDKLLFPQKNVKFAKTWVDVLELLKEQHKGDSTSVAIYPCGPIQHTPFEIG